MLAAGRPRIDASIEKIYLARDPLEQVIRLVEISAEHAGQQELQLLSSEATESIPFPVFIKILSPKAWTAVEQGVWQLPNGWKLEELELLYVQPSAPVLRLDCGHVIPSFSGWVTGQEVECSVCQNNKPASAVESDLAIPMRLVCPECSELHIDEGEFATKPHHTHACQHCGNVWRPAVVNTVGVRFLPGFKNA